MFGGVSDHEHSFVQSYLAIEQVMLGFGFGPLLFQELRFAGCGVGTFATSLYATPRPQVMTLQGVPSAGFLLHQG